MNAMSSGPSELRMIRFDPTRKKRKKNRTISDSEWNFYKFYILRLHGAGFSQKEILANLMTKDFNPTPRQLWAKMHDDWGIATYSTPRFVSNAVPALQFGIQKPLDHFLEFDDPLYGDFDKLWLLSRIRRMKARPPHSRDNLTQAVVFQFVLMSFFEVKESSPLAWNFSNSSRMGQFSTWLYTDGWYVPFQDWLTSLRLQTDCVHLLYEVNVQLLESLQQSLAEQNSDVSAISSLRLLTRNWACMGLLVCLSVLIQTTAGTMSYSSAVEERNLHFNSFEKMLSILRSLWGESQGMRLVMVVHETIISLIRIVDDCTTLSYSKDPSQLRQDAWSDDARYSTVI